MEGGRSSAPLGEDGRAEGVLKQRRGQPPRRQRPGSPCPVGGTTQRRRLAPSVCVRVRLADSAVRDPAVRLLGGRVGRESAGPFLRGDGSGVEGKQRSRVAGSSALRLPRVCGTVAHSQLTAATDFGGGGAWATAPVETPGASPGVVVTTARLATRASSLPG
uniref:Uncharacterized protein n=1 Tax=Branchiostoma floridae TaxID=7739 RepID=C3ZN68_BRAFL|eukprot:XP_002590020.1 hypothetical protein BRAFLDRAFT_81642 [Branchiostoma floridae]